MSQPTFSPADLSAFCSLDGLGLDVTGQYVTGDLAVLSCQVLGEDRWCHECGCQGRPRDSVIRSLAHIPFGWRPTRLDIRLRRYKCVGCGHVWRQTTHAGARRAKLSDAAVAWGLEGIVCDHLSVARVAEALAVSWNTANTAIMARARQMLIDTPDRLDSVRVIGVDEHVWRHTRKGDKYVTVIIDLTPVADSTGTARFVFCKLFVGRFAVCF